jgi:disulfide bond formation protein DsbB
VTEQEGRSTFAWAVIGLALALAGVAGSLYLSIGMGLKACPLCFYQRTFLMGVAAVLLVGLLGTRSAPSLLCVLSLPMATAGLAVAAYHEYLVLAERLECPEGLFGLGVAPLQSLVIFLFVTLAVGRGALAQPGARSSSRMTAHLGAIGLGVLLAYGCIASSPPPAAAQPGPLDTCRPKVRKQELSRRDVTAIASRSAAACPSSQL